MNRRLIDRYLVAQILFAAIATILFLLRVSGVTPRTPQIIDANEVAFWSSIVVSYAFFVLGRRADRRRRESSEVRE